MGTPYPNTTASGYNASPPADDGSVTSANKVKWATIKTQLSDPLNVVDGAINTALRTALNVTPTSQSSAYTTTTADHQRPIEVTGTTTISLGDAATMVAASMGYEVQIINVGVATVTVALITAANTLAGKANGTLKLAPLQGVWVTVNSTSNGYDVKAVSNGVMFDSTDPTKQARIATSAITTGTTRVVTLPDADLNLSSQTQNLVLASPNGSTGAASFRALVPSDLSMTPITNSLGGDVALNNVANYFDGPSVAQGTSGTWFASGTVVLTDGNGAANFSVKLWDGTTVIASTRMQSSATGSSPMSISVSGYIASPAGNIRISVKDETSTGGTIRFNSSGNSKDSTLTAIRIA